MQYAVQTWINKVTLVKDTAGRKDERHYRVSRATIPCTDRNHAEVMADALNRIPNQSAVVVCHVFTVEKSMYIPLETMRDIVLEFQKEKNASDFHNYDADEPANDDD